MSFTLHHDHLTKLTHPLERIRLSSRALCQTAPAHLTHDVITLHLDLYAILNRTAATLSLLALRAGQHVDDIRTGIQVDSDALAHVKAAMSALQARWKCMERRVSENAQAMGSTQRSLMEAQRGAVGRLLGHVDEMEARRKTLTRVNASVEEAAMVVKQARKEEWWAGVRASMMGWLFFVDVEGVTMEMEKKRKVRDCAEKARIKVLEERLQVVKALLEREGEIRKGRREVKRGSGGVAWSGDVYAALKCLQMGVGGVKEVLGMIEECEGEGEMIWRTVWVGMRLWASEMAEVAQKVFKDLVGEDGRGFID